MEVSRRASGNNMAKGHPPASNVQNSAAMGGNTTGARVSSSDSSDQQARETRELLKTNRSALIGLLNEGLTAILQTLLMKQVLSLTEADQVRRKQRPQQKAASLIDIISRKATGVHLKVFCDTVISTCPQTRPLLTLPGVDETSPHNSMELPGDRTEALSHITGCLKDKTHGPHYFFRALKSIQGKGIELTSITFEHGFNILHEIVRLDRLDLLKYVSYSGQWTQLYEMRTDQNSGPHSQLTPLELASSLKRDKIGQILKELNEYEMSLRKINRCVREADIGGFSDLKQRYIKHVGKGSLEDNSLLESACQSGSLHMLQEIIRMEQTLFCRRPSVDKALALCVDLGQEHLLQPLLEYMSVNVDRVVVEGKTLTERAAVNGDIQTFRKLEALGAKTRETIVALAAAQNRLAFLQEVLATRRPPQTWLNYQDKRGKTAAHFAAEKSHTEVVRLLLDNGHDLKIKDKRGYTVLHAAAGGGSLPTLEAIIDACIRQQCLDWMVTSRDVYLGSERCYLVRGRDQEHPAWHYVEALRHLIDIFQKRTAGGSVDVAQYGRVLKSGWGMAPSQEVIQEVEAIYDSLNANPNAAPDMQPLHIAIIKRNEEVALRLISAMDNVNQPDSFGLTPLHLAAMRGNISMLNALLNKGGNRTVQDMEGRTPVDIAQANDHPEAVKALTEVHTQRLDTTKIRRILLEAHANLSDDTIARYSEEEGNAALRIKSILRDVISDIHEYMYDCLGEGPVTSESGIVR